MRNDLNEKVWGWVMSELPIGYSLDVGFNDHRDHTFYECMAVRHNFYFKDDKYLVKLNGCVISEIYSMKEAQRILKLEEI